MQSVRMSSPVLYGIQNHCLDSLVAVCSDSASVKGSASVDNGNLVTAAVSENLHTMSGFVLVQSADSAVYIARIEKFHKSDISRANIVKIATFVEITNEL